MPQSLAEVEASLLRALVGLESGTVEPRVANSMAAVARSIVAIRDPGDIDRRLIELERIANTREAA
jgi:hypothetical protein